MNWDSLSLALKCYTCLVCPFMLAPASLILYALGVRAGIIIRHPRIWSGKEIA